MQEECGVGGRGVCQSGAANPDRTPRRHHYPAVHDEVIGGKGSDRRANATTQQTQDVESMLA